MATDRGKVAAKIMEGYKLTEQEWEAARAAGIFEGECLTYAGYLAAYYEGKKTRGMVCTKHPHREFKDNDGAAWLCGYGLHLEDLEYASLTDVNKMLIAAVFGRQALAALKRKG